MNTRKKLLAAAEQCVCTDRNEQYGEPEDNFKAIAEFWTTYIKHRCVPENTEVIITPMDVANMMVLFKQARAITALVQKEDTYIDMIGYAACAGECALKGKVSDIYKSMDPVMDTTDRVMMNHMHVPTEEEIKGLCKALRDAGIEVSANIHEKLYGAAKE